jgi:hypothetical protein
MGNNPLYIAPQTWQGNQQSDPLVTETASTGSVLIQAYDCGVHHTQRTRSLPLHSFQPSSQPHDVIAFAGCISEVFATWLDQACVHGFVRVKPFSTKRGKTRPRSHRPPLLWPHPGRRLQKTHRGPTCRLFLKTGQSTSVFPHEPCASTTTEPEVRIIP